jgi:peptidoglycan/LPS O-acetylase OafA/YrhL
MKAPMLTERRNTHREGSFWICLRERHLTVLYRMQPTGMRLILAWASMFTAIIITISALCGTDYKTIDFLVPQPVWGFAFFLHWFCVTWRINDLKKRVGWALAINSFGLFLWILATIASALDPEGYPHGLSACIALCIFSAWSLYRTDRTEEPISP